MELQPKQKTKVNIHRGKKQKTKNIIFILQIHKIVIEIELL